MQFFFAARIHYSGYPLFVVVRASNCWQRMGKAVGDFGEAASFLAMSGGAIRRGNASASSRLGGWGVHARIAAQASASCSGTTQRLATELEAARIMAQLTPSSQRPKYTATCSRS